MHQLKVDTEAKQQIWGSLLPPIIGNTSTKFGIDLLCLDKVIKKVKESSRISQLGKEFVSLSILQMKRLMVEFDQNPFEKYSPVIFESGKQILENALSRSRCAANTRGSVSPSSPLPKVGMALMTNGLIPNIQEWLLYYLLIGFEKIIIFDDTKPGSEVHKKFMAALQPFLDTGRVEINQFGLAAGSFPQGEFNNRVLNHYKENKMLDWIAYFDMDELFLLKDPKSFSSRLFSLIFGFRMSTTSDIACIDEFLTNYENYGGVGFRWKMVSPHSVGLHDPTRTYFDQYKLSVFEYENGWGKKVIVQVKYTTELEIHHASTSNFKLIVSPEYQPLLHHGGIFDSFFTEHRHYGQGDLTHAILNKACGASRGRSAFQHSRVAQLLSNLETGSLAGAKDISEFTNTGYLGQDLLRTIMSEAFTNRTQLSNDSKVGK